MIKEVKEELAVRRKLIILNYARETAKPTKAFVNLRPQDRLFINGRHPLILYYHSVINFLLR
jgi:hypothetical protein